MILILKSLRGAVSAQCFSRRLSIRTGEASHFYVLYSGSKIVFRFLRRERTVSIDRHSQIGSQIKMDLELDIPDSASQWYKLKKNPRLFFWWLFHRITTPLRVLPDFLVIGVMKGGTTSFFNYLARHPQIRSAVSQGNQILRYTLS